MKVIHPDPFDRLEQAVGRPWRASSDFDLNPETVLPPDRKLRPAGVLIGITAYGDEPQVILTKRSSHLRHHPGQIAFPGGKVDDGDRDEIAASLRETQEEIGLDPALLQIIGTMPTHETITGFVVTPVLAKITQDFAPIPEAGEVAEVFRVPLTHLMNPDNFLIQSRRWRGQRRYYYVVPWGPYYIWGATARMLRGLADQVQL